MHCTNCSVDMVINNCYKCGTRLMRKGPDVGSCKNCGVVFIDSLVRHCMACGHDLAVMIIEPPLLKVVLVLVLSSSSSVLACLLKS